MVMNHLLTGMILQIEFVSLAFSFPWLGGFAGRSFPRHSAIAMELSEEQRGSLALFREAGGQNQNPKGCPFGIGAKQGCRFVPYTFSETIRYIYDTYGSKYW